MTIATLEIEQTILAGRPVKNLGARAQRLLFASTGTKDPSAADTLYVDGLAAPNNVNTMPQGTLKASALAERLQVEGAEAFVQSWRELLQAIDTKSTTLRRHAAATAKR